MKLLYTPFKSILPFGVLLVSVLLPTIVKADIWYVSTTGNDTLNGKFATFTSGYDGPKATIDSALFYAASGDTVFIEGGFYNQSVTVFQKTVIQVEDVTLLKWTINATGDVCTLIGDTLNVTDTLDLVDGIILINSYSTLLRMLPGSEVLGGHSESYVEGRLYRALVNGSGILKFPLGKGGDYRPLVLNYNQNVVDNRFHYVELFNGKPPVNETLPAGISHISNLHYWDFNRVGPGNATDYIFECRYDTFLNDDQIFDYLNARVLQSQGLGTWVNLKGGGDNARSGFAKASFSSDTTGILVLANPVGGDNLLGTFHPLARFDYTGVCVGTAFTFQDTSLNNFPATNNKWHWDFGDPAATNDTAITKNPVWTYTTAGDYSVTLWVQNDSLNSDSVVMAVKVHGRPKVGFTANAACKGQITSFSDTSKLTGSDTIQNSIWKFGDGFNGSGKTATHTYALASNYNVKLISTSSAGCIDSATQTVMVKQLPKVGMDIKTVCLGQNTIFKDTSKNQAPDTILSSVWKYGDGSGGSGRSVAYSYGFANTYNVKLISKSSGGCIDSAIGKAIVNALPKLDFALSTVCINDTLRTKRTYGLDSRDSMTVYKWNVNHVFKLQDTTFKYRFPNSGPQKISLIATNKLGCTDSVVKSSTSWALPTMSFVLDNTISGNDSAQCLTTNKYTFKPVLNAAQGQTVVGIWKFGDGSSTILSDSTHVYSSTGTFKVTLTGTTVNNCKDSFSAKITVKGFVKPNFGKIGLCAPDSITVYDSASQTTSPIVSYQWNLPAGLTATGNTAKFWNKPTGPIDVELIATNAEGCSDSTTHTYFFTPYPVVSFLMSGAIPFCPGDSVRVRADGGADVRWLHNNDTARIQSFRTAGQYKVLASNSAACTTLDSFQVVVYPNAQIIARNDTTIVRGGKATLYAAGGLSYSWTPIATLNKPSSNVVVAIPAVTTSYYLVGTDGNGCTGYDTVQVTVAEPDFVRIPNIITPNGDGENDYWDIGEIKNQKNYSVIITNYAGKVVFEADTYNNDWQAKDANDNELAEGIFYYKLKNKVSGEVIKGFIQVIR